MTASLHEAREDLSPRALDMHRALVSLIEELEAVDWYSQRVAASKDETLKAVLSHSLEEEKEHACMTLEWIRRHDSGVHKCLRRFLFRDEIDLERLADVEATARVELDGTLGIGSLRAGAS